MSDIKKSNRGGKREGAGRPRKPQSMELKKLINQSVDFTEALKTLMHIVNSPKSKDSDRIKVVELLLAYNYGKPHQSVAIETNLSPLASPERIAEFWQFAETIDLDELPNTDKEQEDE